MSTEIEQVYLGADETPDSGWEDAEAFYQEELGAMHLGQQAEFHVTDEKSADWVGTKYTDYARAREARKAAWMMEDKKLARKMEWLAARFSVEIEEYAMMQLMAINANKKTPSKSLRLPCGMQIGYRKVPDALKVIDEAAFEAWVVANKADYVKDYRPEINTKALLAALLGSTEVPEGAQVVPASDKFFMKA